MMIYDLHLGVHGWHSMNSPEHRQEEKTSTIAGLEMSVSFANSNDLDTILKAAKATKWQLPPLESKLLSDDIRNCDITGSDCVTFSVTVTNAWIPNDLLQHSQAGVDKSANVYVRYKFFDHDSIVSTLCPLSSRQPHSIETRFENLTSARIAHKKSFVCKRSRPLHWYLREEKMEIQIWLTYSTTSKESRPSDADKLLGSCYVELSSISEFEKEQHISGSFPMFKAGLDSLGGKLRVYVSMKPGELPDPIADPQPESVSITNEVNHSQKSPILEEISPRSSNNDQTFDATVTIERAFHLPRVNDLETNESIYPNVYVSFDVIDAQSSTEDIKTVTIATRIVTSSENVSWNEVKTVSLPKSLLTGSHGGMSIKVWHRDRLYMDNTDSTHSNQTSIGVTDRLLGFATVDLSVLRAGFRDVNGWYNILDVHGQCQGQLKVAVTPSNMYDSQPGTARSNDTMLPCPALPLVTIPPNFLHKVPIDIPVQTPSGSMYVPGVQSCLDVSESKSSFLTCPKQYAGRFHADFCQADNIPAVPTASMFRYVTSDQQQASLVNTLEKQINELESIKKKFEERKRARFQDGGKSSENVKKPTASPSDYENLKSMQEDNDTKPPTTETIQSDTVVISADRPHSEIFPKHSSDSSSSPRLKSSVERNASAQRKSIHLSLYQSRKNAELDDRALSDNDVDSDIEFVRPHSLNESLNMDENHESQSSDDRIIKKPPHVALNQSDANHDKPTISTSKHFDSSDVGDVVTPGRSEAHSALDDTSLWLTGSTLRESGLISDDENGGKADDVCSVSKKSQDEDQERESVRSDTPRSAVTPLDEEIHDNDDMQTGDTTDMENPAIDGADLAHKQNPHNVLIDMTGNADTGQRTADFPQILSNPTSIDNIPHDVDEPFSHTPEEMTESPLSKSPPSEEHLARNDVPEQDDQDDDIPDIVPAAFSDCEQEDTTSEESYVKSQNEENHCPNCKLPESKLKQKDSGTCFYPPSRNIKTSILEIQEATLAHKVSCLVMFIYIYNGIYAMQQLRHTLHGNIRLSF